MALSAHLRPIKSAASISKMVQLLLPNEPAMLFLQKDQPEDLHVRQKAHLILFPLAQDWLQTCMNYSHKRRS